MSAEDEGGVVGDEGLAFDEFFKAGLPVFTEFIGFGQIFPAVPAPVADRLFSGGRM